MFDRLLSAADLVRAAVLASGVYEHVNDGVGLKAFERVASEGRDRITYRVGEAYETLRALTPQPFALGEEFASKWQFLP